MARSEPVLVACEECGALNEGATALLSQTQRDLEGAERDLRGKRAQITRLEGERHEKLKKSKRFGEAMTVLRYWQEKLMPTAREIDSPDRLEAVIARLNGKYVVEDLKLCVDGYVKRPYVTKDGRSAHGTKAQWKADAVLIFSTPRHVDSGIAWANSGGPEFAVTGDLSRLSWRRVKYANRQLIVQALTEQFGAGLHDDFYQHTRWPCPRCNNDPACTLVVSDNTNLNYLAECSQCGLDDMRLIAAITEEPK